MSGDVNPDNDLDPDFLQRTPSHITIRKLTDKDRSNTFPRVKRRDDGPERASTQSIFKSQMSSPAAPRVRFDLDDETATETNLEADKHTPLEEKGLRSDYDTSSFNTKEIAGDTTVQFMDASDLELLDEANGGIDQDDIHCEPKEASIREFMTMKNTDAEIERPHDLGIRVGDGNDDDESGFSLPQDFFQRLPSHITVKSKHYNTYPNLQRDFNIAKELVKTQMRSPLSHHVPDQLEHKIRSENLTKLPCESQNEEISESTYREESPCADSPVDVCDSGHSEPEPINVEDESPSESSVCMECVKAIEVRKRGEIQTGDHLIFSGTIYDHHAIVVGKPEFEQHREDDIEIEIEMVHATNTSAKATFASLHPFGSKARLRRVKETINLESRKVMKFIYSSNVKSFSREEIVKRAIAEAEADLAGGQGKFKYNVFQNNCEHFATWCVTGRKLSLQVRKFNMVFWMFLKSGFYDISDECIRNEKEYENGMLCKKCFEIKKKLLDIPKKKIMNATDVIEGDIIIYSYYFLWHSAVVLQVLKRRQNYVKCEIAHYAYMGMFKHRTIITEHLLIPLDGTMMVAIYPEEFNVYSREEVVARARRRVGEQLFAFFTNDSSQFSCWCKLKLEVKKQKQVLSNFPSP